MLTHRMLAMMSHAYAAEVDTVAPGDPILHAAPMSHGSGLYALPHVMRAGVNVVPESGGFEPEEIAALFGAWPRASMFAAPTMVKRLVECARRLRSRRHPHHRVGRRADVCRGCARGARALRPAPGADLRPGRKPDDDHRAVARGHRRPRAIRAGGSASRRRAARSPASRSAIVDTRTTAPLPPGEIGEIVCRGDVVMAGYWRNPGATGAALGGGWLHTGDVGAFDADGYLTLKDRSKDLIISGGSNIYPREVEEVLLRHPGVREVSVIGRPRPRMGRDRRRLCRRRGEGRGARCALPRSHRPLQAAEGLRVRRRAAEEQLRQDPEDETARPRRQAGRMNSPSVPLPSAQRRERRSPAARRAGGRRHSTSP